MKKTIKRRKQEYWWKRNKKNALCLENYCMNNKKNKVGPTVFYNI